MIFYYCHHLYLLINQERVGENIVNKNLFRIEYNFKKVFTSKVFVIRRKLKKWFLEIIRNIDNFITVLSSPVMVM